MSYIALKPCTIQGHTYRIHDTIPAGTVLPSAEAGLVRRGYIVSAPEVPPVSVAPALFTLHINSDESEKEKISLSVTEDDLQQAVNILHMGAEEAQKAIQDVESGRALRFVLHLESRKTVMAAAQKRLDEVPTDQEGEA